MDCFVIRAGLVHDLMEWLHGGKLFEGTETGPGVTAFL